MRLDKLFRNVLIAGSAVFALGAGSPSAHAATTPVAKPKAAVAKAASAKESPVATATKAALAALESAVRPLSSSRALEDAFRAYFTFKAERPADVKKPFLYFVDYGLPSTAARGYVFDMSSLKIVDGPFTVAHGRGSGSGTIPTRFSNTSNSSSTSLGLYVAQELYGFVGHSGGKTYRSTGLRLQGVSRGFNDNARARGVVAHGAPYVTASKAGRSQGCPAMETARAANLLPKLANGGVVFLYGSDTNWQANDQWVNAN